jgi:PPOX class probable F420-dependent enzyme
VVNPKEPEGGATYNTGELGTSAAVEETGTGDLPANLRGYPSTDDSRPVPTEEAPVPLVELKPSDLALLRGKHFGHLATLQPDGTPNTVVVWVDIENGLIEVNTQEGSGVLNNVLRDPRVALSIHDQENPYRMISVQGTVIETTQRGAAEHLSRLAQKYDVEGGSYAKGPNASGDARTIIRIRPERVSRYGYE